MSSGILVVHGPNLNMLGRRVPGVYGSSSLDEIDASIRQHAESHGVRVDCRQSNSEGQLVEWLQGSASAFDGIVLNAGAYTHTSIALHDAIRACGLPVVEVHLSNTASRESFRHKSYISPVALGVIMGFGSTGYLLAIDALISHLGMSGR